MRSREVSVEGKIVSALKKIKGAFSLVLMTKDAVIGIRDPMGFRPLAIGKKRFAFYLFRVLCS